MDKYDKIILRHIISIITTLIFLIVSTYCWFNFKIFEVSYLDYEKSGIVVSDNIAFNNLEQVRDEDINKIKPYNFSISNTNENKEDITITIVSDLLDESISNNYLKYSINDGTIKSLNMDGVIYIDSINNNETKDINLKVWISETYKGELNYNGRVIVS